MNNILTENLEKIREVIKVPEGTFCFKCSSKELMNPAQTDGILFEIASGTHVFRLERSDKHFLKYYYASAGSDTRVATINLSEIPICEEAQIVFTWSPKENNLYFIPKIQESKVYESSGIPCKFQLQADKNDKIYQIGDESTEVMELEVFEDGKQMLSSTAINSWRSTKKALEILETGKSDEGYIYESIVANLTISILVTGLEAYSKKRILELEREGTIPDTEAYFSDSEKEKWLEKFKKEAGEKKITLLQYIVEKRVINFQNYENNKRTFNKIFGIGFGSIGCRSDELKKLKTFITFRHRIIHVSALTGILNQLKVPPEKPIFSNKKLSEEAIGIFDLFIEKLHEATLQKKQNAK
ncbi:MAG: hypothetical protein NTX63_04705 [Candidatus Peregrinibacteria bacterium]|nr:hypothetical protein [Candidatus Peregrinibacteria bacterium]